MSPALPKSGVTNGIVTYVGIMRDALRSKGHRISVVAADEWQDDSGQVHAFGDVLTAWDKLKAKMRRSIGRDTGDGGYAGLGWSARLKIVSAHRLIDIVEIEETFGRVVDMAGAAVPIVVRLHGPYFLTRDVHQTERETRISRHRDHMERRALAAADGVISPTHRLLRRVEEQFEFSLGTSEVIFNPIHVSERKWSVERADTDTVICVGRFDYCKGTDLVLRAFEQALQKRPQLRLIIVGPDTGLTAEDGNRTHFRQFVDDNLGEHARSRVEFTGAVDPSIAHQRRLASGLIVVGSRFDSFSYVAAEAMAEGCPLLLSDGAGIVEVVDDGISAAIVPACDIAALAAAMVSLTSNPQRLRLLGEAAHAACARKLDPGAIAEQTIAFYRRVIEARRAI